MFYLESDNNKKKKIYNNLEEQVQYLTDYHNVNQGLVQWGIRVVGQVETTADLPDPATYEGSYGDAYAVGTSAPFDFYIWTRASIVGEPDYWFPFGQISIVGPQGPKGDKGDKGDTGASTHWYVSNSLPDPTQYNVGDLVLLNNGNVYQLIYFDNLGSNQWTSIVNIKGPQGIQGVQGPAGAAGPQGIQGPKGDTGDVGGFINIYGIVTNVNQLPNPDTLDNRTIAYLLGTKFPYDLYIQVGDADGPVNWVNSGPLNVSTLVMVNGEYQNVWNANTKLDKVTAATTNNQAYVKLANGNQLMWNMDTGPLPGSICVRDGNGRLRVSAPSNNNDAVNLAYVRGLVNSVRGSAIYKHTFKAVRNNNNKPVWISFLSTSSSNHIVTNEYGEITLDNNIPGWDYRIGYNEWDPIYSIMLEHITHTDFAYREYTSIISGSTVSVPGLIISFSSESADADGEEYIIEQI